MTYGAPAPMPARNGRRNGSVLVVTSSTTPPVVSVLPLARPRPGKCLMLVATRATHAADEGGAVGGNRSGRVAELAVVRPDRRVDRAGRHHVDDRGQVEGHAGGGQLAAPPAGGAAQGCRCHLALRERGRDGAESRAGQRLDLATLLIGADLEPHPMG